MTSAIREVQSDLRYRRLRVDPAMAEVILSGNTDNRPVDQSRVNKYAKQMKAGLWKETSAECVQIAGNGRLIDGQHRLKAIIQSQCPIVLTVVDGCDAETFDVIDTGKTRTHNDVFAIAGLPRGTAPLARVVYLYEHLIDKDWCSSKDANISQTELLRWADDKRDVLSRAAERGRTVGKVVKPLATTSGAVMAIMEQYAGIACETTYEVFYRPMVDLIGCDPEAAPLRFYQFIRSAQDSRAETAGPFASNAGSSTENNRKKIILQLIALRDALENTSRPYRWRDDLRMPDVRKINNDAV